MNLPLKQRRQLLTLSAALVAAAFGATSFGARAQSKEFTLGIISTESSANLKTAWQPLLDDLQKTTGYKVTAFFAPDYAGIVEALRFNKVQLAMMGNKSAMEAVDRASSEIFAKVLQADGSPGYWSFMIVHRDSALKTLDDVLQQRASLTLGFGDPNSTSGTLVPGYYAFAQNGVEPTKDFKRTLRANHETNILAVANKQIDVATIASDGVDRMKLKMPEKADALRVVWRSPLIASDPMVWRRDLDADAKAKFKTFFAGYGKDAREKEVLKTLTWSGFVASDNTQLLPIRQLELVRERAKLDADTALSPDEKTRKLRDIDGRLADLGKQLALAK